ncbi:MAG: Sapep family Mn(2+)-dependent dipeptidase [Clostridiales bacterium]|nr:Sapep family Mn(2+)-dependent dipeptidase [Clostridiales bacterium]
MPNGILEDLKELLQIESVKGEPEPDAPYGKGPKAALDWFLKKAAAYGLKTGSLDNRCGWAETGAGKGLAGVLCHLDVVPAGGGWSYNPYGLTLDGGVLYGRGVVDDKGSTVAALHALKRLHDGGINPGRRVRLIVGCDEENGSSCMAHYAANGERPDFSIVPDADFPVINSEKGILHLRLDINADEAFTDSVAAVKAGGAINVVPDLCEARIPKSSPAADELKRLFDDEPRLIKTVASLGYGRGDFTLSEFEDGFTLQTRGTAGHAMAPEKADNAVHKLFGLLCRLDALAASPSAQAVNSMFCEPLGPERLGIAAADKKSGALTMSLDRIEYKKPILSLWLDLRLPLCIDKNTVVNNIGARLPRDSALEILHFSPNLYVDEKSPLITALLNVYEKATGQKGYTVQSGGGTYARALPNAVAFGPTFPGAVTDIHNADEHIGLAEFNMLSEIYYTAIIAIAKL